MIYLLDVNVLVALAIADHEFHARTASWAQSAPRDLATCSIVELGLIRVLTQVTAYGFTVAEACSMLHRLKQKSGGRFTFIHDGHEVSRLPAWVRSPKQITDGHLSGLAAAHGAILATLDESIPDSYLIPK